MKKKRDLHSRVRIIYRACRRLYGKEKTQDECLRIFKAVFPHLNELRKSEDERASVPSSVRNALMFITCSWRPKKQLALLIADAESWIDLPFDYGREELIQFYEDIMPVAMRIRKLTPRECFRLMDVEEKDIDKIQNSGLSKSAQYKLAGNSIVVSCLYHIFDKMLIDNQPAAKSAGVQLTLF